jgi:hypothetical protein
VVGKRCLTGSLNCDPSFYSHTRTNKCTRCRSKAAIRLLPALAHRQLCAAFKEIALELGLTDEPIPATAVATPVASASRGHQPAANSPPMQVPPPSSTMIPPRHVPTSVHHSAAQLVNMHHSSGQMTATAHAAPRRARALPPQASGMPSAAGHPQQHGPGPAILGPPAGPNPLVSLSVPVLLSPANAHPHPHPTPLGPPAMLVHQGHLASAGSGMAPGPVAMGGMAAAAAPSSYPYSSFPYGVSHYWVDAHGVAHALGPGLPPGAIATPPAGMLPQGFTFPSGGMAWSGPSSSLR